MKVYKIRNTKTGLFSTGGLTTNKTLNKIGKIYTFQTLNSLLKRYNYEFLERDDLEVVEFELSEIKAISIEKFLDKSKL